MSPVQVRVITLKDSVDRQTKVKEQLSTIDIAWSFIDAIDGRKLNYPIPEYDEIKVNRLLGFPLTPSEIGCFLSHQKAWQECVMTQIPTIVFEDDFILLPNFKEVVTTLLSHHDLWNLVRLQALTEVNHHTLYDLQSTKVTKNHDDPLGATCYLINPKTAQKLIDHSQEIFEPLDHFIEHEKYHGIQCLAINPYIVDISHVETTIADRPNEERRPKRGLKKLQRSISRFIDRTCSKKPWFPK